MVTSVARGRLRECLKFCSICLVHYGPGQGTPHSASHASSRRPVNRTLPGLSSSTCCGVSVVGAG